MKQKVISGAKLSSTDFQRINSVVSAEESAQFVEILKSASAMYRSSESMHIGQCRCLQPSHACGQRDTLDLKEQNQMQTIPTRVMAIVRWPMCNRSNGPEIPSVPKHRGHYKFVSGAINDGDNTVSIKPQTAWRVDINKALSLRSFSSSGVSVTAFTNRVH